MTICSERISSYLGRWLAGDRRSSYIHAATEVSNQPITKMFRN